MQTNTNKNKYQLKAELVMHLNYKKKIKKKNTN